MGAANGGIPHFGALCCIARQLQADGFVDEFVDSDDAGFDDAWVRQVRARQQHFDRLIEFANRLDRQADGSGHLLRRSLCMSLQLHPSRVEAIRSLIDSVDQRPADERADLFGLVEQQLIVGFGGQQPMIEADRRRIYQWLGGAGTCRAG